MRRNYLPLAALLALASAACGGKSPLAPSPVAETMVAGDHVAIQGKNIVPLPVADYALTVYVNGTAGSRGYVNSSPSGIRNCAVGQTCTARFAAGTSVTLTGKGSIAGWAGGCNVGGSTCTLTLSGDTFVQANFY